MRRIGSGLSSLFGRGGGSEAVPDADLEDDAEMYYDKDKGCWQKKGAETDGASASAAPPPKAVKKKASPTIDTAKPEPLGKGATSPAASLETPRSRLRSRYVDVLNPGAGTPAPTATQGKEELALPFPVRPTAPPANVMMFMPGPKVKEEDAGEAQGG